MRYASKVYSGQKFLTEIKGSSLSGIKRKASEICNNHYNEIDELKISVIEDDCVKSILNYVRINRKTPDNTIVRGAWK